MVNARCSANPVVAKSTSKPRCVLPVKNDSCVTVETLSPFGLGGSLVSIRGPTMLASSCVGYLRSSVCSKRANERNVFQIAAKPQDTYSQHPGRHGKPPRANFLRTVALTRIHGSRSESFLIWGVALRFIWLPLRVRSSEAGAKLETTPKHKK